jgi:hypothetical protein
MRPIEKAKKFNRLPERGAKLKIKEKIMSKEECRGFFVHPKHLDSRRPKELAEYWGYVPGAGGDVWWVKHQDETIGAYMYTEVTDVPKK